VTPICRPRSKHCCSSSPLPVKQCSMPCTPLPPNPAALRISANLAPASLQCMNSGLRSSRASCTCAANHCSWTSGGLKLRLKSSPHSPAAQCSAVQCSAVQPSPVQSSPVKSSEVQWQCSAVQCSAVQSSGSAVQCSAVQCSAAQCSEAQCSLVLM